MNTPRARALALLCLSFVPTSVLALGPARPGSIEGEYVFDEPCTGFPEHTICCGPGDLWTELPLPLASHVYDKDKDGRPGGARRFGLGTIVRVEAREGVVSLAPIGPGGAGTATVLRPQDTRSRRTRFTSHGVSVRDRFSMPATGMSWQWDFFREFRLRGLEDGSLEIRYRDTYFKQAEESVCRLRRADG